MLIDCHAVGLLQVAAWSVEAAERQGDLPVCSH